MYIRLDDAGGLCPPILSRKIELQGTHHVTFELIYLNTQCLM